MTAPAPRAVFLSYASQDVEAAKRLCEALRAAGFEVWLGLLFCGEVVEVAIDFDAEGGELLNGRGLKSKPGVILVKVADQLHEAAMLPAERGCSGKAWFELRQDVLHVVRELDASIAGDATLDSPKTLLSFLPGDSMCVVRITCSPRFRRTQAKRGRHLFSGHRKSQTAYGGCCMCPAMQM